MGYCFSDSTVVVVLIFVPVFVVIFVCVPVSLVFCLFICLSGLLLLLSDFVEELICFARMMHTECFQTCLLSLNASVILGFFPFYIYFLLYFGK